MPKLTPKFAPKVTKMLSALAVLLATQAQAHSIPAFDPFEFPEERNYPAHETGFTQYGAPSMRGSRQIVLTFDDGPSIKTTPKILDILKERGVHATFFVLTEQITPSTRPLLERMVREGHLIGSHDHTHRNNNKETQPVFKNQLKQSLGIVHAELERLGATESEIYYRYPYGDYGRRDDYNQMNAIRDLSYEMFGGNCINFVFWNIDSLDYVPTMSPADIPQQIIAHFEGGPAWKYAWVRDSHGKKKLSRAPIQIDNPPAGGVVLMHDIQEREVQALPKVLDALAAHQIEIVPLNSVAEYRYDGRECGWPAQTVAAPPVPPVF